MLAILQNLPFFPFKTGDFLHAFSFPHGSMALPLFEKESEGRFAWIEAGAVQQGLNFGKVMPSPVSSNTTCTGMSM